MPLNENPFFIPVMRTIDMIAQENLLKQREERAEERQLAYEERQQQYQQEQAKRRGSQEEYGELTKAIQAYPQAVEAGGEPQPDILKSMVERRNALIKSGEVTPRMIGQIPAVPEIQKAEQQYFLTESEAKFFGVDPQTPLDEVTWRIFKTNYKNYFKPRGGAGKGETQQENIAKQLDDLEKEARERFDKGIKVEGMTETEGIIEKVYINYMNKISGLRRKLKGGTWTEDESKALNNLPTFDEYYHKFGTVGKGGLKESIAEIKKILTEKED